jgi:hypothetical protein
MSMQLHPVKSIHRLFYIATSPKIGNQRLVLPYSAFLTDSRRKASTDANIACEETYLNKKSNIYWPSHVKNTELKILWAFLFLLCFYYLQFHLSAWSSKVLLGSILNVFICLLVIHLSGYRLYSLCTVFSLTIILFYPVCALLNLALPTPAVRPDLWRHTPEALTACSVGMFGFLLGQFANAIFLNTVWGKVDSSSANPHSHQIMPRRIFLLIMYSSLLLAIILKMKFGVFYHITIQKPNPNANVLLNALETISWIGVAGISGFLVMAASSKNRQRDLATAIILMTSIVVIYLPSGSRMQAAGYLPALAVIYLAFEKKLSRRLFVLAASPVLIVMLIGVIGFYRVSGADSQTSLIDRTSIMYEAMANQVVNENDLEGAKLIVHRLSDYVATGRLVAWTPEVFDYRTFEGMQKWWQVFLPGALRPKSEDALDFNEGTLVTLKYHVSDGPWVSTPITVFGDLFSRFGWTGLCFGMMFFGFVYRGLDRLLWRASPLFSLILFVLYFRFTWQLYVSSFLVAWVSLIRDLPFIMIITLLLTLTWKTHFKGNLERA